MGNEHVMVRVDGIRKLLLAGYQAGAGMSSATKGGERELFIDLFLSQVLPVSYRFGTGEVTDSSGSRSGQLDVVVEFPFLPSLPVVAGSRYRLYLAESVACVIEVKSNLSGQWSEVSATSKQLATVSRSIGASATEQGGGVVRTTPGSVSVFGGQLKGGLVIDGDKISIGGRSLSHSRIPLFAIGYTGWSTLATAKQKVAEGKVDGILVIDSGIFVTNERFGSIEVEGAASLWGLICSLHESTRQLSQISTNPMDYAR